MTSSGDWNESVENLDYLVSCVNGLEREDVIYLEEYLVCDDSLGSQSPGYWASLREERHPPGDGACGVVDESGFEEVIDGGGSAAVSERRGGDSGEVIVRSPPAVRSTRGVTKPKFVSYEVFPTTKNKEKPFMCELCGLRLATRESRRRHILSKHIKERTNVCGVCGKAFIFKFALKTHQAVHSDTPSFICVCGSSFKLRSSYMDHVRRIHRAASEMTFMCELCFKSFGDRHTLRIHLTSVHKPKTIPCTFDGCGKLFSTTGLMTSHYRYHLKHRFTCVECGQTFSTESYMYKHRDTHSGIRPYVCTDCGKTYLSTSHLNKHRRAAHSTLRPYQCSYCGKCYKGKDQLTYHENSHRGEKPYQCSVCGYATAYRHTYYVHKKKHLKPSLGDQNANQDDGLSSVVKDRKPIRKQAEGDGGATKTSTLRKVKSRVTVSTNKKQLGKVVECQVESVPTVVSQCTSVGGSKDGNESSFASSSLPLSVIYVVSAGGGVNGVVQQQQLTLPVKDGSNAILIQSGGDGQDVSLPSCVQSGSNHQTLVHPQDGTHQTLVNHQDGTHQTLVHPQDGTHQTLVHPQDGTHQTLVHPQDGTHQTLVHPQDGTHQTLVHPQDGTHQTLVHPQDGTHQTLVHPQDGTHQTLVNHQDGTHQTLVHPQDGTQQMLVHPQVVKTTFPTNNQLENNRLESFKPSDKDVNASSEKQESCIFLSSTGKCAVPSCDSRDDSLMLLKVSDNSYVGICGHHAFTEGSGDGLRQLGAIDVQPLAAVNVQTEYDVKTLHLVTPGSTDVCLPTDVDQRGTDNQEALITTAENDTSDAHAVIHQTDDMVTTINSGHVDTTSCHHTTSCHTDTPSCHHTTTSDTTNQAENSKMTPGVVSSVEEFPTILELDAEGDNLPGHIVDESFSMAQLEVLCPLCDEQFFCMADYVTHLESCHN